MPLEWSVAGLLLAAALWPWWRKTRSWGARVGILLLVIATLLGGFAWQSRAHNKLAVQEQWMEKLPAEKRSGGFVRSESCRSCHPDQYTSWHDSFHRTMTQRATPEAVRGDFTNVTLSLDGETYHLSRRGDEFWVNMIDPDWKYVRVLERDAFLRGQGPEPRFVANPPRADKRVTLTTGSHHMQTYWVAGEFGNQQFGVPFTFLFEESRWLPRPDVFLMPPDAPHLPQVWNNNCLGCHATAGQPQQDQRSFVMNTRVAEQGIACESCHGPAEGHIRANSNPRRRYALHRGTNGDPTIVNPARLSSQKSSEVCGQCHAARYSRDHKDWMMQGTEYWPRQTIETNRPLTPGKGLEQLLHEPGGAAHPNFHYLSSTFWPDGMIRVSGREYSGLVETPCFQRGSMSCLSCHSMHQSKPDDQLARGMEGNQACLQCHGDFAKKLTQHTHHAANSAGSLCYNCHMPHTTYGLLKGIRSHQITSPNVKTSLDTGRPDACNLCHLDKSLAWTAKQLNTWYRQPVPAVEVDFANAPASAVWLLRGDAGQRALVAWHMGWEPAQQASSTNWLVPYLAETLDDPYSVVRHIGQRSLRRVPGFERLAYDYIAPGAERVRAKSQVLQRWNPEPLHAEDSAKILSPQQISRLLQGRDHRAMELLE